MSSACHRQPRFSPPRAGSLAARALPLLAGISLAAAQQFPLPEIDDPLAADTTSGFLAGTLLPDGAIIKNVILPSYDDKLRLTGALQARELVIVTRRLIDAKDLEIRLFHPDQSLRGVIGMSEARFDDSKRLLSSRQPVSLKSDDLTARGSGLDYDVANNRGVLHGPVETEILADRRTSMNMPPSSRGLAAGAVLLASALAVPAQDDSGYAARMADFELSPEQIAQIDVDAAPARERTGKEERVASETLLEAAAASTIADTAMNAFFKIASLPPLLADGTPADGDVPAPEIAAGVQLTRISAKERLFFDSPNGLLVFLKDVVVRDPRIDLTATDELKVFFDPKPEEKTPVEGESKKDNLFSNAKFGDPSRIVATGIVVVEIKSDDPQKPPIKASARTLVYDIKKEEVILRGGSPWAVQGSESAVRTTGPNAFIRVNLKEMLILVEGDSAADFNLQRKR